MVVDECIGRCLDVGSTPTGSIKAFHSLAKLRKTLIYQRFFFLCFAWFYLVLPFRENQKETQFCVP